MLASVLDKPVPVTKAPEVDTSNETTEYYLQGRETKATKQMFLASNCFATGETSLRGHNLAEQAAPENIDWTVQGLPTNCEVNDLKKIA